jgi:hypothetical protein
MKSVLVIALLALSGCADMTPAQKKWTTVAASILVVGAIAVHNQDSGTPVSLHSSCAPTSDGVPQKLC